MTAVPTELLPGLRAATAPALMVTDIPATHPRVPYFRRMATLLENRGVACQLVLDGERYPGRAALDAVRSGAAQMAWINAAHLEAVDAALGVLNLPFFFSDDVLGQAANADRVLDLLDQRTAPAGLRTLGLMRGADQLFASTRALATSATALEGLKVRVAGPGVYEGIMRALGATPVAMPIPLIRQALAGGTLDALFTSPGGWQNQLGLDAPHALRVPGLMLINYVLVVNGPWYGVQAAATQATLQAAAAQCVTHAWRAMAQDDLDVLAAMAQAGAHIAVAHDAPAWRARLAPLRQRHFADHPQASAGLRAVAEGR